MASAIATRDFELEPADNARLKNLCGPLDEHLHQIEQGLSVDIRHRGNRFQVSGEAAAATGAEQLLKDLFAHTQSGDVTPERVHLSLRELGMSSLPSGSVQSDDELALRTHRGGIQARGPNQKQYLSSIRNFDLTLGIGPAGTGKTYLAVACAVEALQADRVRRIVLVRPAVEAG